MIGFGILPSRTTASITDEKACRQIGTAVRIKVYLFQQFMPHACPWLSILVSPRGCEQMDGEVELTDYGRDLGLEEGQASLVALNSFGVTP